MNALVSLVLQYSRTSTLVSFLTVSLTLYKWLIHHSGTKRLDLVKKHSNRATIVSRLKMRVRQLGRPHGQAMAAQFDALTELRVRLHVLDGYLELMQIMLLRMDGYMTSLSPVLGMLTSVTGVGSKNCAAPIEAPRSRKKFGLVKWRTNK